MSPTAAGAAAGLAAACIWGVAPVFFSQLGHVPPGELLAHRIVWGCLFTGAFCLATGRGPRVLSTLRDPSTRRALAMSASLITVNWFTFLWAVQAGRVTESGLGYYLMPIVSVALGVAVLGERLSSAQWTAVALAALAVGTLSLGLGQAPLVPLVLAVSFALYGLARKRGATGAIVGFQVETILLVPLALGWLGAVHAFGLAGGTAGAPAQFGREWETTVLLVLAGPVTGLPLILFAEAARRLPYATTGLIQYLNPTMQVAVAALLLGETLTPWHAVALALIWAALALYTASAFRAQRAARRAAMASSGVATTVRNERNSGPTKPSASTCSKSASRGSQ